MIQYKKNQSINQSVVCYVAWLLNVDIRYWFPAIPVFLLGKEKERD